jgi:hypothetical protein
MSLINSEITATTFWATLGIVASAVGGLFTMQLSHTNANGHSSMARQAEVSEVKIKIERIATEVNYNKDILSELKADIRHIREEQGRSSKQILEAIKDK